MKKHLVSIIVPCNNQAQYLDEALQSLLKQTHTDWECFIVNDGSPDNTAEVARKWIAKDSRFIYLYKENGGVSSARNLGIKNGKGEFILTLDADDRYEVTFLEKAITVLLKNRNVGIVSSWGTYFIGDKQFNVYKLTAKSVTDFLFHNAAIGTSLFRKTCWDQVDGYDENPENGYEDWEFYIRVCKLGWEVHIIEEALFYYRQHLASRSSFVKLKDIEVKKYIYLKHKDLYINHYEVLIDRFLITDDAAKVEIYKLKHTIDYKMGSKLLKPLRILKRFLKGRVFRK